MKNPYEEMRAMSVADLAKGIGAQAFLFCALGAGIWAVSGREITEFVSVSVYEVAVGVGLGLALIAVAHVIFRGFPDLSEKLVRMQARNFAFLEKRLPMTMIIFISICAGVGEEALFRAGLMTILSDYTPFWVALVASSAVFTVIHFAKPLIASLIFIIGATFGLIYWWTGSLLIVMIGHAVYDVYALWYLQSEMHRLNVFEPLQEDDAETT